MNQEQCFITPDGVRVDLVSTEILELWQQALKRKDIPLNSNFLEIGGDSISAIFLIDSIQNIFGVPFSVNEFLHDPTVVGGIAAISEKLMSITPFDESFEQKKKFGETQNSLASKSSSVDDFDRDEAMERYIAGQVLPIISDVNGSAITCLVELKLAQCCNSNSVSPLFLVHPVGGTVSCYKALADALPDNLTVYGLQSPFIHSGTLDCIALEEICQVYVQAIRAIQPEGPYRVAGWSGGGVFTYEIAQQLSRLGLPLSFVGIIDTEFHYTQLHSETPHSIQLQFVKRNAKEMGVSLGDDEILELLQNVAIQKPPTSDQLKNRSALQANYAHEMLSKNSAISRRMTMANRLTGLALISYFPAVYSGKVTFFRTAGFKESQLKKGPMNIHWGRVVEGGIDIVELPGNHVTIVFPPLVNNLAKGIVEQLLRD